MYELNLENIGELGLISQSKYAEELGLTTVYLNQIFKGKLAVKLTTAKCMISLAYNITVRGNDQMKELLDKHFTLVK